jgi:ferredoxin
VGRREALEAGKRLLPLPFGPHGPPACDLVGVDDRVDEALEEVTLVGRGRAPGQLEGLVGLEVGAAPREREAVPIGRLDRLLAPAHAGILPVAACGWPRDSGATPVKSLPMTYVIAEPCIDIKDRSCVDVCPVDCIHEAARMLVIDPEECIDCGACEPECPVEAIFPEDALPEKWEPFVRINYAFPEGFAAVDGLVDSYATEHHVQN